MEITYWEAARIANHVFGGVTTSASYTPTPIWYMGLSTSTIYPSGAGISEPTTVGGYKRMPIPNDKTNWMTTTTGSLSNLLTLDFDMVTTTLSGNIYYAFLTTGSDTTPGQLNSGCVCYYNAFAPSFALAKNTTITFDPDTMKITFM